MPLLCGERVDGYVYFAKRWPRWYGEADVEVAQAVASQIVLAMQHQRLAEKQQLLGAVEARAQHLEARVALLRSALGDRYDFARVIRRAPAFLETLEQAQRVAPTESTVLLTGESGTGKEVLARAIHHASARAEGPFIAINCAALPDTLIESELFGHERGAFTGADRLKRGRFELAAGGTLFLDAIGELTPAVQAQLLRVLQERQYERVGGMATLDADVRLIAATNRDLERGVAEGGFREDLYYRLAVFPIRLPALRDRGDDVILLAEYFVRELGAKLGKGDPGLGRDAREVLLAHQWPGNIRELQNAIERALIVSDGEVITADQLGIAARRPPRRAGVAERRVPRRARPRRRVAGAAGEADDRGGARARGGQQDAGSGSARPHPDAALHSAETLRTGHLVPLGREPAGVRFRTDRIDPYSPPHVGFGRRGVGAHQGHDFSGRRRPSDSAGLMHISLRQEDRDESA